MPVKKINFNKRTVDFYFNSSFSELKKIVAPHRSIIITDENIFAAHSKKLKGWDTIVLKAGEEYKVQQTVDSVIDQLIQLNADRQTTLIGLGGGMVTDITGYVASVFLRGVPFGFLPTTVLAMVDAAIGGKNGIDVGLYKNMVGTINQPHFLLYDVSFLKTLPVIEWRNGFAEIIKHAAIKDEAMFKTLKENSLKNFQKNKPLLQKLIQQNAFLKIKVVQGDEFEKGERRLLNFGHTLGHALEKKYNLMHGEAVAVGMAMAANLSEKIISFKQTSRLLSLLDKYGLPTSADYSKKKIFEILISDKKRDGNNINFILLEKIGKAVIRKISFDQLYKLL
ncbi:MAG: 3-dehydroquinate synthase [Chitinophagaceae bacterium]